MIKKIIYYFALIAFCAPLAVSAQATLLVSPSSGVYKVGDTFSVLVNVNSGGEAINAASVQMSFDNTKLEVTDLGFSRSIFNIWTEEPKFSNAAGSVSLSGGLPTPGFSGASGAILRVNFKAKSVGQASVILTSGSVLANDGNGTNILDSFKGGLYNIISAAKEKDAIEKPVVSTSTPIITETIIAEKPINTPTITEWPRTLEGGDTLSIKGLAYPNGKIFIFVQKSTTDPIIEERFAGDDGRFSYNFSQPVEPGSYRVWAKNVVTDGTTSASSETITVQVSQPLFLKIGNITISYITIIVSFVLLFLIIIMLLWFWIASRKKHERHRREIALIEEDIHKSFDLLKEDIEKQVRYLEKSRIKDLKDEVGRTIEYLKKDLDDAEKFLRSEIEGIEKDDQA